MSSQEHKVTIELISTDEETTRIKVRYTPDVEGSDIESIGYLPASFKFFEEYIFPALVTAYEESDAPDDRTLN